MGSVSPTPKTGRPVYLNMVNNQSFQVEAFEIRIGFRVLQQLQQELGRLLGPAALRCLPLLGLGTTTDTAVESTERDALLLIHNILQEPCSATQGHFTNSLSRLPCVLQIKENHHG